MSRDNDEVNLMTLAFELGKFPHELEELPISQYERLLVYADWRNKEEQKLAKKNKKK